MTVTTGWVKPARQTKGLDPLGSQAPGILLYSQLLPGITNGYIRDSQRGDWSWHRGGTLGIHRVRNRRGICAGMSRSPTHR